MRYAIVIDGSVVNVILADAAFIATILQENPDATAVAITEGQAAGIGDTWDGTGFTKAPAVASAKTAKNLAINEWRAIANQTTFPYLGKLIACDQLSRSDIEGVANSIALNGTFPQGFPMCWKTTDNTYVSLPDIPTFKAMYDAMVAQGSANFAHAQQLKASLASATTQQQIDAIVW